MSIFVALWTPTAAAQSEAGAAPPGALRSIKDAPSPAGPATTPATGPSASEASVPLKPEEVEQVVAGIALYPDSLLAQVLMASTYPLEVVQADRWAKANKSLKDKALADALNQQTWDASVKSLVNFPQVLTMMSEKLDWTMKLGDAFIADQKVVMDAIQRLRHKAQASGNLKTTEQQNVKVETVPAAAAGQPAQQVIVVESSSPSVVYVPTYNPSVVYGGWPYPSYPPYSYYPPGYVAGAAVLSFGVGVACGAAWGHAWGGCNWGHSEVDIDVDRNVNFNNNINREEARQNQNQRQNQRQGNQGDRQGERDTRQGDRQTGRDARQGDRQASGAGANARASGASTFQHDPSHRKGVSYRDSATNQKYRGSSNTQAAAARESYRGRADAGRQDLARGGASGFSGSGGTRSGYGSDVRGSSGSRSDFRGDAGSGRGGSSSYSSGTRSSSFSGVDSGGSRARAESSRGQYSRSSSSYGGGSRSYSGGGSRSYGGGGSSRSYGGGGGRGGGGRGGGGRR